MILPVVLCAATLLPAPPTAAELTAKEREFAITYLEETRKKFLASIEGVTPAQWTFKAGPDRWSIAETAEHIGVSESTILGLVTGKIINAPAPAGERMDDEKLIAAVVDRSPAARFQAPEMLKPTNRWATSDALKKDFNEARDKTIAYVKDTKDDLRGHAAPHPVLKSLDAYQWVLLIAAHSARHTAQIEEVKTAAGYPKH
jgi:DinB family protein